jgi:hypothetical protein
VRSRACAQDIDSSSLAVVAIIGGTSTDVSSTAPVSEAEAALGIDGWVGFDDLNPDVRVRSGRLTFSVVALPSLHVSENAAQPQLRPAQSTRLSSIS